MELIRLENVNKIYKLDKNKEKYALKNVSLTLDANGLVCILGKSGSGKSTLLNLIGLIDKPSSGKVFFNYKETSKWGEKKISQYHRSTASFVFQHYHLLEQFDVLYNVKLPLIIQGYKEKEAEKKAIKLLEEIDIKKVLYNQKCIDLSGGEKERIAILRALIKDPKIILADEPTGALDSNNSIVIMDLLKKISSQRLVVVVTHNEALANEYADRIIQISDGVIKEDRIIHKIIYHPPDKKENKKYSSSWMAPILNHNFKKRFKRNLVSLFSLIIGLTSSLLIFGFSNGSGDSLKQASKNHLDISTLSISKEKSSSIEGSPISIVQTTRPFEQEMEELYFQYPEFDYLLNYDALVPPNPSFMVGDTKIEGLTYSPIYSFDSKSFDRRLLIEGRFPKIDSLYEVVINKPCFEFLKSKLNYNPLDTYINVRNETSYNYYTQDVVRPYITDYFVYNISFHIVGVVNELSFLSSSQIYYSYKALDKFLSDYTLNNLSEYLNERITWQKRIKDTPNNDALSCYSYRLFLKDIKDIELIYELKNNIQQPFVISSSAISIEEALMSLFTAATMGMELFLAIAIIGSALILGIISFSYYSQDRKMVAILKSQGVTNSDIQSIYLTESILIGLCAFIFSMLLAMLLSPFINRLIFMLTGFNNLINIPIKVFMNKKFLLPILMFIGTIFICILATELPIIFSKRISIKEELKDE